ncbi:hypothetical protein BC832DRAFT_267923 [Gaertneriomyces semiglobifer]|nr:hypothetical protein BC832DRAFT_267923 [Gaertneriomyces semiglobifer]
MMWAVLNMVSSIRAALLVLAFIQSEPDEFIAQSIGGSSQQKLPSVAIYIALKMDDMKNFNPVLSRFASLVLPPTGEQVHAYTAFFQPPRYRLHWCCLAFFVCNLGKWQILTTKNALTFVLCSQYWARTPLSRIEVELSVSRNS